MPKIIKIGYFFSLSCSKNNEMFLWDSVYENGLTCHFSHPREKAMTKYANKSFNEIYWNLLAIGLQIEQATLQKYAHNIFTKL